MTEWFAANKLFLNVEKTNVIKSVTNNLPHCAVSIGYMKERVSATFLGLRVDNRLNWKDHINQMIPKPSQQDTHSYGRYSRQRL